jgi:hypothetical protein
MVGRGKFQERGQLLVDRRFGDHRWKRAWGLDHLRRGGTEDHRRGRFRGPGTRR